MTADEFIAWAVENDRGRFELVSGEVVAMAPERAAHARSKALTWAALTRAIASTGLQCEAFPDGMAVRVNDTTVYEPDAFVRCGKPIDRTAIEVHDPCVVVEVLSPSTRARDAGAKLDDYFRIPSVHHYLILKTETQTVIHHARNSNQLPETESISTRILSAGVLTLDPPGLELTVEELFPAAT